MSCGTAIVTGGTKRIGRALALALASDGFDLAIHYHTSEVAAQALLAELRGMGVRARAYRADLAHSDDVLQLIPRIQSDCADISLLINNASVFDRMSFLETEPAFFENEFAINLRAPFFLSRDFARFVKNGQIINLLDTRIRSGDPDYFAYSLTKQALYHFTRLAARELAPGIRVNGICPGPILPPPDGSESELQDYARRIPLGVPGHPEQIVRAMRYLIQNTFVTGDCLFVDGGEQLI
ncbi:MAG: SDR family oxidoreductase [Leptospiraceae bacterium]|nr:SDR family oxidoreductase [Leptospiraceae bacterium]